VITLVDSIRIDMLISVVKRLVEIQIREADICLINKIDASNEQRIKKAEQMVRTINPTCEIIRVSGQNGTGVKEVADIIEKRTSERYDKATEKEMLKKQYGSR
jgi:G3E family GTPase